MSIKKNTVFPADIQELLRSWLYFARLFIGSCSLRNRVSRITGNLSARFHKVKERYVWQCRIRDPVKCIFSFFDVCVENFIIAKNCLFTFWMQGPVITQAYSRNQRQIYKLFWRYKIFPRKNRNNYKNYAMSNSPTVIYISRSFLRILNIYCGTRCEKYSSKLDISRSFLRY